MSRPALCESARLATLAADEKASLPGGAFSVEAPALGETNRAAGAFFCVSPVLGETNFAAPRSVGGFAAGVEPSGPLSSGGGKVANQ